MPEEAKQTHSFEPVIELTKINRTDLIQTCGTPGYKVIHRILRNEVDKYVNLLINTPVEDKGKVYGRFVQLKTASQIYQGMADRINAEVAAAFSESTADEEKFEPDATESSLDIGELASTTEDIPNLLGDVEVLEGTD